MDAPATDTRGDRSVLITGAAGFIGINLVRAFAGAGYRVSAHDHRPPSREAAGFLSGQDGLVSWARGDIRDAGHLDGVLGDSRPANVIHAAAITPADEEVETERARDIFEVNLLGTVALLEASARYGVGRLIVLGSCSAISAGGQLGNPIPEGLTGSPEGLYGVSKLAQELAVRRLGALLRLNALNVRLSQPYGPMEQPGPDRSAISPIGEWIEAAAAARPVEYVDPDAAQDWLHIEDLVRAIVILAAAPEPRYRSYNLGYGALTPVREVIAAIGRAFPDAEFRHVPGAKPNRNLLPTALRPPLPAMRLADEFGYQPRIDIAAGIESYAAFLQAKPARRRAAALSSR